MSNGKTVLNWVTLLDDADWEREETLDELLPTEPPTRPPPSRHALINWLTACLPIAILLTAIASSISSPAEPISNVSGRLNGLVKTSAVSHSLNGSAAAVLGSRPVPDHDQLPAIRLYAPALASTTISEPISRQQVSQHAYLRTAQVDLEKTPANPYRDALQLTRSYAHSADAAARTTPSDVFWGQRRVMESAHFRIYYRQADAAAVIEASAQLDAVYETLLADIGRSPDSTTLAIDIAPTTSSALGYPRFERNYLEIPSPFVLDAPVNTPDSELIIQSVAHSMVTHFWHDLQPLESPHLYRSDKAMLWAPMIDGVKLWQAHTASQTASGGYVASVSWLYNDAPAIQSGQRAPTAQDLYSICRLGEIWRYNIPASVSPVALCSDVDWSGNMRFLTLAPTTLDALIRYETASRTYIRANTWHSHWARRMAASTLIDYYVSVYGRDQLPLLIAAFQTHDDWESLTQDLLNIPADEFEKGWRYYLKERFDQTLPLLTPA